MGTAATPPAVIGAAVLAYLQAGVTVVTSTIGVLGLTDAGNPTDVLVTGWLLVVAQLTGAVLLIVGGVRLTKGASRTPLIAGTTLELAICTTYLISFVIFPGFAIGSVAAADSARERLIAITVFLAIMPATSLVLALGNATDRYLQVYCG